MSSSSYCVDCCLRSGSRVGPSTFSSKTNEYLFSEQISLSNYLLLGCEKPLGGGNSGSTTSLKVFSINVGISLASSGHDDSKHGFVFTSIK
jgi:hypothetical protein